MGGWVYIQPHNGGTARIPKAGGARDAGDLVESVRRFRLHEGIPIGDPDFDIASQIRKNSPQNDIYRKRPEFHPPKNIQPVELHEELRAWLDSTAPRRPALIHEMDADTRAEVCAKCPFNVPWKGRDKAQNTEISRRAIVLRGVVFYAHDDSLRACALHRIELSSAVFLDQDFLPKKAPQAPDNCWIPL